MNGYDDGAALSVAQPARPRRKPKRPAPQRHQWFDAWMMARGDGLKALVNDTVAFLDHHETHTRSRTRARKPRDQAHHLKRIEAVVCNLAHAVLAPPPTGRIAVQLGNARKGRSRYDSPILGKPMSPLIHMLWDVDILNLNWSTLRGEVSSVAPSAWFAGKVREHGVQLSDFGRDEAEEVVVLTRNTREVLPWWSQTGADEAPQGADRLHRHTGDHQAPRGYLGGKNRARQRGEWCVHCTPRRRPHASAPTPRTYAGHAVPRILDLLSCLRRLSRHSDWHQWCVGQVLAGCIRLGALRAFQNARVHNPAGPLAAGGRSRWICALSWRDRSRGTNAKYADIASSCTAAMSSFGRMGRPFDRVRQRQQDPRTSRMRQRSEHGISVEAPSKSGGNFSALAKHSSRADELAARALGLGHP